MKRVNELIIWVLISITLGFIAGSVSIIFIDNEMMGDYDLYNCIYNNADSNGFTKNPELIDKIQNECICFREHDYTNLLDVDCSSSSGKEKDGV